MPDHLLTPADAVSGSYPQKSVAESADPILFGDSSSGNAPSWIPASYFLRKYGADSQTGASQTVDFDAGNFDNKNVTLTGNGTITIAVPTRPGTYNIFLRSSGATRRTVTWSTSGIAFSEQTLPPTYVESTEPVTIEMTYTGTHWKVTPTQGQTKSIVPAALATDADTIGTVWMPNSGRGVVTEWHITGALPFAYTLDGTGLNMLPNSVVTIILTGDNSGNTPILAGFTNTIGQANADWSKTTMLVIKELNSTVTCAILPTD